MNKEQDYTSDTDESDDDFRPDDLADESAASEVETEDCESDEGSCEDVEDLKKKHGKRKCITKKVNKEKIKSKQQDESDDDDTNTSRRVTRQKEGPQKNGRSLEKDELLSEEEDKSRTNALWADFLKDVNSTDTFTKANPSNIENRSSSNINGKAATEERINEAQPKMALISKGEGKKEFVTEVEFADEDVSNQCEIDSSIKENKAATLPAAKKQPFCRIMPGVGIKRTITAAASGSAPGLGSILNQLGKKKKLSVLEKSQMDWKSFKQSEGIDEQLQTFNRGKDGYLERQDFLQRTDLRQFEIEKNLRQTTRRPH